MSTIQPRRARVAAATACVVLTMSAVGGVVVAQSPVPLGSLVPGSSPSSPASIAPQLDVNTATLEAITAAFVAAGIPNADRWAQEVVEYRPYEADPTWARLRQELGKYNIDPVVLERIIAVIDGIPDASPAPSGVAPAASGAPVASTAATIDANTATVGEIAAAFTAAGIPNADRWAQEVVEYRPYEADPTWARLRQELGKYHIDPAVLEQILALLRV